MGREVCGCVHPGAGAVLSSGLMRRARYQEVENKIWNQRGFSSGDSAFTDVIWDKMRVLATDPGGAASPFQLWGGCRHHCVVQAITRCSWTAHIVQQHLLCCEVVS